MKIVMTQSEICNVIILIIQAIILLGQLRLSKRMYKDDISKEKGYLLSKKQIMNILIEHILEIYL